MVLTVLILAFKLCLLFVSLTLECGPYCKPAITLTERSDFCKSYNLPLHYSNKQRNCCCKSILDPQPGYIVIWDEGNIINDLSYSLLQDKVNLKERFHFIAAIPSMD